VWLLIKVCCLLSVGLMNSFITSITPVNLSTRFPF
jgi:hypothetical protein